MAFFISFLFIMGAYLIICDFFKIPTLSFSKTARNIIYIGKNESNIFNSWKSDLAAWLSRYIHINEYKKLQLETDLKCAGLNCTPEQHIADSIVRAMPVGLIAVISLFILPLFFPFLVALSFLMYIQSSKKLQSKLNEKRTAIEFELPRLVDTIRNKLKHSRDVLQILDEYRSISSPELKEELSITIADMRSGNHETAITRLESRVGSTMLSDVTRGLLGIIRGDINFSYWDTLSIKFSDSQRQLLRLKAQKIPGKVNRLSMCLLGCFIFCYLVVIGIQIYTTLGKLFS